MVHPGDSTLDGVRIVPLHAHKDERGRFVETFRQAWLPAGVPLMVQSNRSDSARGVLRGLHYHRRQADWWYAAAGRIFVALFDLRPSSGTYRRVQTLEISEEAAYGIYIPPGIAHGFQAITDATLTYLVDAYYDGTDELGLAWDDPAAAIDWPLAAPILSARDRSNPKLDEIPPDDLPG